MNKNTLIIASLIVIICCLVAGLIYTVSLTNQSHNNATLNNTNTNNTTNTTNETVSVQQISKENNANTKKSSSSKSSDSHPDWVCEGDTWYSKQDSDGEGYVLYDKSTGRAIGSGDMPDRHGYHSQNYIDKESSTVKYRSNGEYYEG